MKTPQISLPKLSTPKVSKKALLIAGAAVIVLALFTFAVSNEVKAERQANTEAAQQAAKQDAEKAATRKQIASLQAAVATEQSRTESVCQWVRGVQAQRRQAIPPLCVASKL